MVDVTGSIDGHDARWGCMTRRNWIWDIPLQTPSHAYTWGLKV
jgi:hypothetical protein